MQDIVELQNFYRQHPVPELLVLCTLVRKLGSSYRDVGAKKIVAPNGKTCGLLSGGCLEASIEKTARERADEMPFVESFSTLSEEDRLLGYQTGCQGVIDILFEKMNSYTPELMIPFGTPARAEGVLITLEANSQFPIGHREFSDRRAIDPGVFFDPWIQPVRLVIIGCGSDADAYLPFAKSLGWNIQFLDYRRELAFPGRFQDETVDRAEVTKLAEYIPQGLYTAVVLMTHNYEADLEILRSLKNYKLGYLGCLGPAVRYQRLKKDLLNLYGEIIPQSLDAIVNAPAGIFSHSRSPSEIALSVVTQIQERLIESSTNKTWTLILAAGASSRFGGPKALAHWKNQSLIARAQDTAQNVSRKYVMVVTGGYAEEITPYLGNVHHVYNEKWKNGMGTSIATGVHAIRKLDVKVDTILILPVDQPLISAAHLLRLARESYKTQKSVLTINLNGVIGAPAAIFHPFFDRAEGLIGDRGLKSILEKSEFATIEDHNALYDVDKPEDLKNLPALQI